MILQAKKYGTGYESTIPLTKAIFEKIMINSEEIGKKKMGDFDLKETEKVRSLYAKNDELFETLKKEIIKEYSAIKKEKTK